LNSECEDENKLMYQDLRILKSLHWLPIRQRLTYKLATLVHKCIGGRAPKYLTEFCHPSVDRRQGMRSADSRKLHVPRTQTSLGDRSFAIAGPRTWNNLPDVIRDSSLSFLTFAKLLDWNHTCLTTAAPVIFNWHLTNAITN